MEIYEDEDRLRVPDLVAEGRFEEIAPVSVGGYIIEIVRMTVASDYGTPREVMRIWVVDKYDETCVYAEPAEVMPRVGEQCWWQGSKIYFDRDRRFLKKVGYSFSVTR